MYVYTRFCVQSVHPLLCTDDPKSSLRPHSPATLQDTASLAQWFRRRERKIPGSNPTCAGIFPGSSHTSDLKIGTQFATLPGAWRDKVSALTGWPGVSIL